MAVTKVGIGAARMKRRALRWWLGGPALLAVAYAAAARYAQLSLETLGRSVLAGFESTSGGERPLPRGSILLRDEDTVATLIAVARVARGADSLLLFVGEVHANAGAALADSVGARMDESVLVDGRREVMHLVPAATQANRPIRGQLILRYPADTSTLRMVRVYRD